MHDFDLTLFDVFVERDLDGEHPDSERSCQLRVALAELKKYERLKNRVKEHNALMDATRGGLFRIEME